MPAFPVLCPWRMKIARIWFSFLSYIPAMTSAPFRPEGFGSGPRSAGTGAEGSLDAELGETILARSGMEDGLISCPIGLFSVLRTLF